MPGQCHACDRVRDKPHSTLKSLKNATSVLLYFWMDYNNGFCHCLVAKSCPILVQPHGFPARLFCTWDQLPFLDYFPWDKHYVKYLTGVILFDLHSNTKKQILFSLCLYLFLFGLPFPTLTFSTLPSLTPKKENILAFTVSLMDPQNSLIVPCIYVSVYFIHKRWKPLR